MRRLLKIIAVLAILIGLTTSFYYFLRTTPEPEMAMDHSEGVAIVITGAAARIPQEAALLEQLYNSGEMNNIAFISGVSSGALNAVMLNAILDRKYTWKRYKDLLFSLTNQSIFYTTNKPLPVNTEPLRQLLTAVLHDTLHYQKLKDLPYPTSLSTVSLSIKSWADLTYRIPGEYPLFDFNNLKDQYIASRAWAQTHKPIPLATFLKEGISIYD